MIQRINVTIKGITPLLMHAFPITDPPEGWEKWLPPEQAKLAEYRTAGGSLFVPGIALQRSFIGAAIFSKGKGRASLQKQVAACCSVFPDCLLLLPQEYTVDSRPIVNPTTKGRVMRHRPRFDQWQVSFEVEFDSALVSESEMRKVVDDSGTRVGILDFRPERKGMFGRFMITKWQ